MFRRRRARAWYINALLALLAARIIYGFAKFFMKITQKQAGWKENSRNSGTKFEGHT